MSKRAFGPFLARSTICFTLILGALAHGRTTVAQELSPDILRIIPGVAEKLRSSDINERLSVLDQLVTVKETVHRPQLVLPYDLRLQIIQSWSKASSPETSSRLMNDALR
jgi:hypothetical protein